MEIIQRIKNWFAALFGYSRRNSDLRDEIECHIEMRTDMNIEGGMNPKAARVAAIKEFGGIDKLKEQCRDAWGIRVIMDQFRNLMFGLRLSTRYLSSSILAVIVLGIGIAISITMYTISTKFLDSSAGGNISERHLMLEWDTGRYGRGINTQDFKVIREEVESLEELVAMKDSRPWFDLPENHEDNKQYKGLFATSNLFDLTDTIPLHGRLFSRKTTESQSSGEIVISHALWSDFFNQDESAVGSAVFVANKEYMVVGVMPVGFAFPRNKQFWVSTEWQEFDGVTPTNASRLNVVGKLRRGVTIEQSLAELSTLSANLSGATSEPGAEKLSIRLRPYKKSFMADGGLEPVYFFIGGAFLVLMLACSNVFHIIISRTARRSHELAVRCSLGAKRGHIMWQVIVDGLTLAGLGAIVGFSLAALGLHFFSAYAGSFTNTPGMNTFHLKPSTALFTIGAALVAGIAASALPAWRASKIDAFAILKDDSNSSSSIFVGWLSKAIVISQISFSAVVIFLSYLFLVIVPSQYWSKTIDLPYNENSVLTAQVKLPFKTLNENVRFYTQLKQKLKEVPGVRATAFSSGPAGFMGSKRSFKFEFQETESHHTNYFVQIGSVTPDYLEVYNLDPVSGRMFNVSDTIETAPVCVVNSQFVESYCNNVDPIGMRLKIENRHDPDASEWITIIGVVPNHRPEFPIVPAENSTGS